MAGGCGEGGNGEGEGVGVSPHTHVIWVGLVRAREAHSGTHGVAYEHGRQKKFVVACRAHPGTMCPRGVSRRRTCGQRGTSAEYRGDDERSPVGEHDRSPEREEWAPVSGLDATQWEEVGI